jgi:hypothetical protein
MWFMAPETWKHCLMAALMTEIETIRWDAADHLGSTEAA